MSDDDTSGATLELAAEVADNPELSNQGEGKEDGNLEQRLKDTQRKLHEVTQERAKERETLLERLARLEGAMQATQPRTTETQPDPMAFLDDPELKEKFFEDAERPISAIKRAVSEVGKVLPMRDQAILARVEQMIAEKLGAIQNQPDPSLRATMDKLRRDPDFAQMDDKTLAVFARKLKPKSNEYPGGQGGSRASSGVGDFTKNEIDEAARKWAARIYGEEG